MNLTTTKKRVITRVRHQPVRAGFMFEYGPDGDGPMLRFMVKGEDDVRYGIALNADDIDAIAKAREEYKALFHGYPRGGSHG